MALTRSEITDAAYTLLAGGGLGALTMRRLAQRLQVQPGAIYHHVASKQELLTDVAERILGDAQISQSDPAQAMLDIRAALLPIRDSAEVVSFVNAFRADLPTALQRLQPLLEGQLPAQEASWAARTLIHYLLGFVAEEQNQAELVRARILAPGEAARDSTAAFRFGVELILRGVQDRAGLRS